MGFSVVTIFDVINEQAEPTLKNSMYKLGDMAVMTKEGQI